MKMLPRWYYRASRLRWRVTKPVTVGVRLMLEQDGAFVLVKHTYLANWYLPGGGVQKGETIEQAARREAAEEIGAELGALQLFGLYTNFLEHKSDHVTVLSCTDFALGDAKSREIERFELFGGDDLPDGVSPGTLRRIDEYLTGRRDAILGMW